jgi:hypothetical protein
VKTAGNQRLFIYLTIANKVPAHINSALCFQRLMLGGLAVAGTGPKGGRGKRRPYRSAAGGRQVLRGHRLEACATEFAVRTIFALFSTGAGRENVSKLDTYAIMKL